MTREEAEEQIDEYSKRVIEGAMMRGASGSGQQAELYRSLKERLIDEMIARREAEARAEKAEARVEEFAEQILRLTKSLKYVQGIVERGTGKVIPDDEIIELHALSYVKRLEARVKELEEALKQSQIRESIWEHRFKEGV